MLDMGGGKVLHLCFLSVSVAQEVPLLLEHDSVMCLASYVFTACRDTLSYRVDMAATHAYMHLWMKCACMSAWTPTVYTQAHAF